jgi:hypothetical protein
MAPPPQVEEMFVCASGARIVSRRQIACQIEDRFFGFTTVDAQRGIDMS